MTPQVRILPITIRDLAEVGDFLHQNLSSRFSAAQWIEAMEHEWSTTRPNFGAQMRAASTLVGVMLAIYSEQTIDGRTESFCNPHSWCVLPEYRNQGIGVVLHLIKQAGYHFTMLTPNPKVAQIFRGLRFKDLDDGLCYFPNLPTRLTLHSDVRAVSDPQQIARMLPKEARRDFEMHRGIAWLRFIAFGIDDDACLVVYKRTIVKRMPCAHILHISNPGAFKKYRGAMQTRMLTEEGLLISRVETRFAGSPIRFSLRRKRMQAKLFFSKTLEDSQIRDLYSELVALDV